MMLGFCASCPSNSGEKNISVIEAEGFGVTLLSASASMDRGMTGTDVADSINFASGVDMKAGAHGDGVCVAVGGIFVVGCVYVGADVGVNGLPGWYTFIPTMVNNTAEPISHQPATTRSRR